MKRSLISYALALNLAPQLGPLRYQKLIAKAGDIEAVFDPEFINSLDNLSGRNFPKTLLNSLKNPDWAQVERALKWSEQPNNHIISIVSPLYPHSLKDLSDAPPLLYVMGYPTRLSHAQIAIVGSRKPSKYGENITMQLAQALANESIVITSGLAHGIDGFAHKACVAMNRPTIAVMGRGLAQIYPAQHRQLAEEILATDGCLVSEFPLDAPPIAGNFPRRNRIISGLSLGTLVIEAKIKSGSLITAKLAADEGKEVFAVPGSVHSELSSGCHHLIQQGAKLVQNAEDILAEIQFEGFKSSNPGKQNLSETTEITDSLSASNDEPSSTDPSKHTDAAQAELLNSMGFEPISIDSLQGVTGLAIESLSAMLLDLELEDWISQDSTGRYQRIR